MTTRLSCRLPPGDLFDTHPEYFSLIEGQRATDRAQLCLTNPEVARLLTARLMAGIRSDPGARLFSVSQNDWHGYCTCGQCAAVDEREGSPSGTMIEFVNRVAEPVGREFPHVWIETLAYQYTRHPPRTVRPLPNVVPRLCTIECDFSVPLAQSVYPQNRTFADDIKGWSAVTDKLYVWDYTTNFGHYLGPHPNFPCLQDNVRLFRDSRVVGLFEQGAYQAPHAEFAELRAWILAKLLWNPDVDLAPLYDDFFAGYYGAAAAPVRTYNVRMGAMPVLYAQLQRWPRLNVTHVWRDNRLQPEGVPPDYAALATDLLERIAEGQVTRVAESTERHDRFVSLLCGRTRGFEPLMLRHGKLAAGVLPQMGGQVCRLAWDNGPNLIHAAEGGVDFANSPRLLAKGATEPYRVVKQTATTVALDRTLKHRYQVRRDVAIVNDGVIVNTQLTSLKTSGQQISPLLRIALDLGGASAVAVRPGTGQWRVHHVPETQAFATASIPVRGLGGSVDIAAPRTGRAVRVQLGSNVTKLRRAWLFQDAVKRCTRLFLALEPQTLQPGTPLLFPLRLQALPAPKELPDLTQASPREHNSDCLIIEECMVPIGKLGTWGEYVADPAADDGFAAKLFNTHYEWCMQWHIDPAWFEPNAQYRLSMRVRVEKSRRQGQAFWAGVYDLGRKKGWGQIAPGTDEVDESYQWYDVTAWAPEANQYVWVGPGQFDRNNGEQSAVKAVYVDKFRLTRITPSRTNAMFLPQQKGLFLWISMMYSPHAAA